MVPLPHPGESPLATALTRVGDSITAPASSPGFPKSLRASQSCRGIAHAAPELRAAGAVVGAAKRGPVRALGTGARGGGGSYLPRRSRGSAWLRLLKLDYSPASRALLEYIPSSGGAGAAGRAASSSREERGPRPPRPSRLGERLRPRGGAEGCRSDTSTSRSGQRGGHLRGEGAVRVTQISVQ